MKKAQPCSVMQMVLVLVVLMNGACSEARAPTLAAEHMPPRNMVAGCGIGMREVDCQFILGVIGDLRRMGGVCNEAADGLEASAGLFRWGDLVNQFSDPGMTSGWDPYTGEIFF